MQPSRFWYANSGFAKFGRTLLSPLSLPYALGWEAYLACYKLGFKKAKHPHSPIICVGNLVVGGIGKTPATIHIAEVLASMGRQVVIGASGYGSPHAEAATIAPDGPLNALEWGDEPALFRHRLPDVPLVIGRRRVLAAQLVHERYPDAVLLMDDGFQHLPLKKDITIVLDPTRPVNSFCLPVGPYREPRFNRSRADLIVATDEGEFRTIAKAPRFVDSNGTESLPDQYQLLCALGQPHRFSKAVSDYLDRRAIREAHLSDHDDLQGGTLLEAFDPKVPIVTSEKDWVKLMHRADQDRYQWRIVKHEVEISPSPRFRDWLAAKLDERQA